MSDAASRRQFFGCNGGNSNGYVCDRPLDRNITEHAYWVPTVYPQPAELVSTRVENYEYSPIWDFIADQAWLR